MPALWIGPKHRQCWPIVEFSADYPVRWFDRRGRAASPVSPASAIQGQLNWQYFEMSAFVYCGFETRRTAIQIWWNAHWQILKNGEVILLNDTVFIERFEIHFTFDRNILRHSLTTMIYESFDFFGNCFFSVSKKFDFRVCFTIKISFSTLYSVVSLNYVFYLTFKNVDGSGLDWSFLLQMIYRLLKPFICLLQHAEQCRGFDLQIDASWSWLRIQLLTVVLGFSVASPTANGLLPLLKLPETPLISSEQNDWINTWNFGRGLSLSKWSRPISIAWWPTRRTQGWVTGEGALSSFSSSSSFGIFAFTIRVRKCSFWNSIFFKLLRIFVSYIPNFVSDYRQNCWFYSNFRLVNYANSPILFTQQITPKFETGKDSLWKNLRNYKQLHLNHVRLIVLYIITAQRPNLRVNVTKDQSRCFQGSSDLADFHIFCSVFHADSRGDIRFS